MSILFILMLPNLLMGYCYTTTYGSTLIFVILLREVIGRGKAHPILTYFNNYFLSDFNFLGGITICIFLI